MSLHLRTLCLGLCAAVLAAPTGVVQSSEAEKTVAAKLGSFEGAKTATHPAWFHESFLDFQEDVKDAAAAGKRVMLYVYQAGCPYCNELVETNFTQKDIHDKTRENFNVIALNMWGDREVTVVDGKTMTEKEFARAIGARYTPTLLFFDEDANIVLRINGYYPPHNLRVALDFVADREEKKTNYADYFRARSPAPAAGALHSEPFFASPPFDLSVKTEKPKLVLFEQKACAPCDRLHQKTLKFPLTRELAQRFHIVQLDARADTLVITPSRVQTTARAWARELDINFSPALVFFDDDGQEVMRADGFLRNFHIQSALDYVLTAAYKREPEFQRYISERAEHLREQGIDVNIWD